MDEKENAGGKERPGGQRKYHVVLVDPESLHKEPFRLEVWHLLLVGVFWFVTVIGCYFMFSPPVKMTPEDAARLLGVPVENDVVGVSFVKSIGPRNSVNLTSRCVRCGYEGITVSVVYPPKPTPVDLGE